MSIHKTPNPGYSDPNKIIQWYCCQCVQVHGSREQLPLSYNCLRCRHMMCPYCVKGRVKDFFS